MKIDDAVAALEQEFGAQTEVPKPDLTLHVSSGDRIGSPIDPAPTLSLNRNLAAKLWYETARDMLREKGVEAWKFTEKPVMDLWRITIADARQTQRIAAERFSVVASIAVKIAPVRAPEPETKGEQDGVSGWSGGGDAAAADGDVTGGAGGPSDVDAAGTGSADGGADADRRDAVAAADAGPAGAETDQP